MTYSAPALARGLEVLRLLASRPGPIAASAIARELELSRSTVYELLAELTAAGFALHLPDQRRWGLGPAAFEVGSAYLRGQPLTALATATLGRLAATTGGVAHLGVLHGAETMYLARERAVHGPTVVTHVGVRLPAALTATGLAMLAGLPSHQVRVLFPDSHAFVMRTSRGISSRAQLATGLRETRQRGWAVEDGNISPDTASLAAAVFDHSVRPIAAIGLTFIHHCPAQSGVVGTGQNSRSGALKHTGCGIDFAEYSTVVRSAAASLTAAIGGQIPSTAGRE